MHNACILYDAEGNPIRNSRLAGEVHPDTGVEFNEAGYPEFDSLHDATLPKELIGPNVSDAKQFEFATQDLQQELLRDPELADEFTLKQLEQIWNSEGKIDGLTWHHNEDGDPGKAADISLRTEAGVRRPLLSLKEAGRGEHRHCDFSMVP